eukprot:3901962-Pyramimonas_sp.AAC.1
MEPEILASSELDSTLPANIVYPDVACTCTGTSVQGVRKLDYFLIPIGLSKAIKSTELRLEAATKPHKPARVSLFPQIAQLQALGFVKPPPIPVECAIGPAPEPPSWDVELDCAQYGIGLVRSGASRGTIQEHINRLYRLWTDKA